MTQLQAFYAAVEERDNPALKDVPMAVGGIGMITTANYKVLVCTFLALNMS